MKQFIYTKQLLKKLAFATLAIGAMTACSHDTVYQGPDSQPENPTVDNRVANTFDFVTSSAVNITVDYSASALGSVYFEIFDKNPYTADAEGDAAPQQDSNAKPLFAGYTDDKGRFNKTITLPAYAKHLYITTGNMLLGAPMLEADVANGRATASLSASKASTRGAVTGYALADGEKGTTVPANLYTANGNTVTSEWVTPLGRYDLHTGRPNYILSGSYLDEAAAAGLVFNDEEMQGLFEAVGNSVNVDKKCPDYLRVNYDLELARESELAITLVGSFTGWNNSLGYYIYEGEAPTDLNDVQVIMLFPNTQDGCWYKTDGKGKISVARDDVDYHGAIALNRGDAVRLYYYPNHTKGNFNKEGETKIFPAGTKIGFVLKNNGWGTQGQNYAVRANGTVTHNWWASSTQGLSVTLDKTKVDLGDAPRTCKFQYKDFVVLGFEDYGDDENFSDLAFAIRPAEAFKPLPKLESKETSQKMGVYGFEDLWPSKGDYDMNDVLVDYQYVKKEEKFDNETQYTTKQETFSFTTYQNYAALHSGLAIKVNFSGNPESVVVSKGKNGNFETYTAAVEDGNIYVLTEDINKEIGTEYRITANYANGISTQSEVEPFIFRRDAEGGKRLEVHMPFYAPSSLVNRDYFHTEDDLSDPDAGKYYVRDGNYPFAFYLAGGDINDFKSTLLNSANEKRPIEEIYPKFLEWSVSKGAKNTDWYK